MLTSVAQLKSARDQRARIKCRCSVSKRIEQVHLNFRESGVDGSSGQSGKSWDFEAFLFCGDRCQGETTLMTHSIVITKNMFYLLMKAN